MRRFDDQSGSGQGAPYLDRKGLQLPWAWIISTIASLSVAGGLSWSVLGKASPPAQTPDLVDTVRTNSEHIRTLEANVETLSTAIAVIEAQNDVAKSDRAASGAKLDELLKAVYRMQGDRSSGEHR